MKYSTKANFATVCTVSLSGHCHECEELNGQCRVSQKSNQ